MYTHTDEGIELLIVHGMVTCMSYHHSGVVNSWSYARAGVVVIIGTIA